VKAYSYSGKAAPSWETTFRLSIFRKN